MAFSRLVIKSARSSYFPGGKCSAPNQLSRRFLSQQPPTSNSSVAIIQTPKPRTPRSDIPRNPSDKKLSYAEYWTQIEKNKSRNTTPTRLATTPITLRRMKCWVQFITTPTADTPGTTLLLHFDNKRYLIGNIAEGTQRAAVQRKIGLLKVQDLFLTGPVRWAGCGGVLGMILTVADSLASSRATQTENAKKNKREPVADDGGLVKGAKENHTLTLHGGRNLTQLIATGRRFVFRKGVPTRVNEFKRDVADGERDLEVPTWQDENLRVWSMVVEPESSSIQEGQEQSSSRSRKRSHEEFVNENAMDITSGETETVEEREARYDNMRKAVIGSMFNSEWKLDTLFKKRLSEVGKNEGVIFVRNDQGHIEEYTGPTMLDDPNTPDREVLMRNPWPGAKIETLPPTTPSHSSICYIFKNHPQRGRFDPKKAQALNVPKGMLWSKLTKGESVLSADGVSVTPDMVLGPGKDGNGFAVVELPDRSYVEPLIARKEWTSEAVMKGVQSIIWILGDGVADCPKLQKFMGEMITHHKIEHFVSSNDSSPNYLAFESAAASAIRLNLLDPGRFPIPTYSNDAPRLSAGTPYQSVRPGLSMELQPNFKVDRSQIIPPLDTKKVVEEASPEVQKLADIARAQINDEAYLAKVEKNQEDIPSKDAEVITLGTGSALPSKYRNVSATLVRVPGYGSYLLDCGENTLGQLRRVFGDELPAVLRDLKAIWISHLHADHHLGTAGVIKAWTAETAQHADTKENKLAVASHNAMLHWLREYSEVEDFGYARVHPISLGGDTSFMYRFSEQDTTNYGLEYIHSCYVQHCHGAMAVVLALPNGFKIAYSGDCRPSEHFARIGQGATLLIHEATFDDELAGDARAKKHSTTGEALRVGKQMGARRILLTHFSQRYQKLPVLDSGGGKDQVAIVAFDYMRVKIGDFVLQEAFKPALKELFKEGDDEVGTNGGAS